MTIYTFSQLIINWYHNHGRKDLPWQKKNNMYTVWISEIMLQQTKVETVIPYFKKFIFQFPNIKKLISTNLNEILYLWSGLGYYSRAVNIYKTAQIINNQYNKKFPEQFSELIKLPGIGQSTAGAILSLSLNAYFPILDGNVKRILIRYNNISKKNKIYQLNKQLWKIIANVTPLYNTNKFNQAMMDIGSLICTPKNPKCNICPLNKKCISYQQNKKLNIVIKKNKKMKIEKESWFIVIEYQKKFWLTKNTKINIWKYLFYFPSFDNKILALQWIHINNLNIYKYQNIEPIWHIFSHFKLKIYSILIQLPNNKFFYRTNDTGIWYNYKNPQHIGIPAPIEKIIKTVIKTII